ncbi:PspC domain-containing protein [Enterococcus sp. DIV0170]|uniref:PspC domain-containing protein n=1 Tax=Enterococcus sp. DIV0170 TaxID=2774642 RepID=UPI003F21A86A
MKPLKKSDKNIVLSGTLGGISEYFNMDPLILRFLFIVSMYLSLSLRWAVMLYIFLVMTVPAAGTIHDNQYENQKENPNRKKKQTSFEEEWTDF